MNLKKLKELNVEQLVYQYMDGGNGCPSQEYSNAMKLAYKLTNANEALIEAAEALGGLLTDITEYQKLNTIGGENNHWQVIARAALAKLEELP